MAECTLCLKIKSETDFYRGHRQCKECLRDKARAYRAANRDRVKAWLVASAIRNRDRQNQHRRESRARNRQSENARQQAYRDANRIKKRAWGAVARAIRDGKLNRPHVCGRCGKAGRIEGSHDDYTKPLEVEWLCVICHRSKDQKAGMGPWVRRDNEAWDKATKEIDE